MTWWQTALVVVVAAVLVTVFALMIWARRMRDSRDDLVESLRRASGDLIRLPGRLRRLAADPRTPRRARWLLIGLAIYVTSPIDPIPDFLPVIGLLDEALLVPLVLIRIRRMIPPEVWAEHFPLRDHGGR